MNTTVSIVQPGQQELPSPENVFEWPRQAAREKKWSEAAQRWAVLRKAYPAHVSTWLQGASAHIEAGELEQAEILLDYARQHFSNHPNSLTDSAELAIRMKKWDVAETYLQSARERFSGFLQTWMKSMVYAESLGDIELALHYNKEARERFPESPLPYIQYAELAMRGEQWEQALVRWKALRERFPEQPAGYLRAAEAARRMNLYKEARHLVLSYQYGADIFEKDPHHHATMKPNRHAGLPRLIELIWTKALFNLRSEVQRNYLSYSWWLLEPLLHMVVYYVVFGLLLQRGGDNYPVFLLTGLIPWMWFSKAISGSSNSILAGQHLMLQVGLPSILFPLVILLQVSLKQIPVFLVLFGFVWLLGYPPGIQWWALIPVMIVQALLTMFLACAVASIIPFVRDLSYLVPTGLTFLMFLSGIFYDYQIISEQWRSFFLLNPVAFLLKCYRDIILGGSFPDLSTLAWWGLGSVAVCVLLIFAYKRLRYVYPRIILE